MTGDAAVPGRTGSTMNARARLTDAVLVIVDISGYTRFVQARAVSLEHAEAIVTELIESIIDRADHPLIVNKLEGDAALLYAETGGERGRAVASAIRQVEGFFSAFAGQLQRIRAARSHCDCDACANIGTLRLKAFMHVGEIVIKQVRAFEEIAGESVILLHRMAKNDVPSHEYVLFTEAFHAEGGHAIDGLRAIRQVIDGVEHTLHWCDAAAICSADGEPREAALPANPAPAAYSRSRNFTHLPVAAGSPRRTWLQGARAWIASRLGGG